MNCYCFHSCRRSTDSLSSEPSMDINSTEHPHTITYEGANIHDVLSSQTTNITILQKLLDQGERPCSSGQCFILAAKTGSLAIVQKLLKIKPSGIKTQDKDGKSLLSYFAKQPKDLLQLLQMGANPAVRDIQKILQCAILNLKSDESEVIEILNIVTKAGVQIENLNGVHILKLLEYEPGIFKHVLALGVNPNIPGIYDILINLMDIFDYDSPNIRILYKDIFSLLASAGLKFVTKYGYSLIAWFSNVEMICHLLKLGAPSFHEDGSNVIHEVYAYYRADYVENLELFIESGYNVLDKDKDGCTFLCSAILICLQNDNSDDTLELVQYMLNHPSIRDDKFKLHCGKNYHPQEILVGGEKLRDSKLVDIIFNSKFKDTRRIADTNFSILHWEGDNNLFPCDINFNQQVDISLIALHLKNCHESNEDMIDDINYLCEHGFSINDPGISPLTVALGRTRIGIDVVKFLLQRGVNAEQKILVLNHNSESMLQDLNTSLKLPDAFLVAADSIDSLENLKLLAPHTAFSPLASLPFTLKLMRTTEEKVRVFRDLLNLGRVPHGTKAYRAIREAVRSMANIEKRQGLMLPLELNIPPQVGGIKSHELTMFDFAHRSPLSLLEQSRYAVRICLADAAGASYTQSLSQLFKSLLPPGLTDQIIVDKIQRIWNAEDKWLKNELELLKNAPSLLLVKCV